ncbi:glycerophosphodiester phosphodiesterase family protein [Devosia sp. SD17-2]|jgi:glycerophosphoryl diester phosphodiesterase|uniref:glycerophosphodiester phosphodiesterase family protein n=1 Tax=Devosia sp. SD17-2 TaxID=2976459 RepID=UPI0023D8A90B|nr:glycerophosphodiester phosphodiesterase family protein [Devosia sp. SD17-2]WEJ31616.1 glycerophosphodiester phosphodiesterase [Devosia sp. SD17-2]
MTAQLFPRPVAHRGLHDRAAGIIENSASAFAAAIAGDFAIECDLQLTSDGHAVVFHDEKLDRLTGESGLVSDRRVTEMTDIALLDSAAGDRPQTLAAFLEQIGGRAMLQIELKHQPSVEATRQLAKVAAAALSTYTGPVTVESFDPRLITLIREFGFSGPRGTITYDYESEDYPPGISEDERYILRHLLHWHETQFDFISCDKAALTLPAITFWRALGKPVTAWTIRSKVEAEAARPYIDQIVFEGFDPDSAS